MLKFITGRTKAIFYSIKGAFLLLKTEHSIQAQSIIALLFIIAGFYFEISDIEWLFQILAICLVLCAESLTYLHNKQNLLLVSPWLNSDLHFRHFIIKTVSFIN